MFSSSKKLSAAIAMALAALLAIASTTSPVNTALAAAVPVPASQDSVALFARGQNKKGAANRANVAGGGAAASPQQVQNIQNEINALGQDMKTAFQANKLGNLQTAAASSQGDSLGAAEARLDAMNKNMQKIFQAQGLGQLEKPTTGGSRVQNIESRVQAMANNLDKSFQDANLGPTAISQQLKGGK